MKRTFFLMAILLIVFTASGMPDPVRNKGSSFYILSSTMDESIPAFFICSLSEAMTTEFVAEVSLALAPCRQYQICPAPEVPMVNVVKQSPLPVASAMSLETKFRVTPWRIFGGYNNDQPITRSLTTRALKKSIVS
jgi:hypothetical protein